MMSRLRPQRSRDDSGSALVATVGVAMISIALSVIVVSQAIVVTNDAARDRVRTVEIHAAEAALDSALSTLEKTTPCTTEMSVGEGSAAVDVTVTIDYYDGINPLALPCANGVVTGKPILAKVTSTAVPVNPTPGGLAPQRRMQATVNLVPIKVEASGAAIFSGGAVDFPNQSSVSPIDPKKRAQIWVDDTNFVARSGTVFDGDLIVANGTVLLANNSSVTGNVWALKGMTVGDAANPYKVGGDVVVYAGNLTSSTGNPVKYGKTVSVSGSITGPYTANGAVCYGTGAQKCGVLPLYTKRGLPTVTYDPFGATGKKWEDEGFFPRTKAQWGEEVIAALKLTPADATTFRANPCLFRNQMAGTIVLSTEKRVYDLSSCHFDAQNNITLSLKADTAFIVGSLYAKNNFNVVSADGVKHKVWFIVPSDSTGNNAIDLKNNTAFTAPIEVFLFTPAALTLKCNSDLRGQFYGGSIAFHASVGIKYSAMGIPGVDLGSGAAPPTVAGFSVHIVNKKELHN